MLNLLIGATVALHTIVAHSADSVDLAGITSAYATVVSVDAVAPPGGDSVLVLRVDAPPPGSLLAGFYQQHHRWFSYLVTHGRSFNVPELNSAEGGRLAAARLQREFLPRLAADSQFNALVVPAIARYLDAAGVPVKRSLLPASRRTVPLDTAMRVATRFFYPDILTPTGILTHVCTVINAVRELPNRDLALEALAFSAIMGDVARGDSSRLEPDFGPARRLMNHLDAPGAPKEVRLSRAQGVMWAMMSQSALLRSVLVAEANREEAILPFAIQTP